MFVVDTSVWLDFLGGVWTPESRWLFNHLPVDEFKMPDLVLCEILRGARNDSEAAFIRSRLSLCQPVVIGGEELAVSAAAHYRTLRGKGITVRTTVDCMIATYCMEHGLSLLHRDRDFDGFEQYLGLRVVRPTVQ